MEGVEPTCLAAPDPKSGASASIATSALKFQSARLKGKLYFSCFLSPVLVSLNKGRKNREFKTMRQMVYQ